ncbi:hypothetical protein [Chromobacterium aquaticum]|uniref:Uncharacterized protein n=1 Tax=Chromobacterium aquaticum TaxID=467180 RepID=A0ABV8ZRU8_9NEIS|nr:hypothetical protein [Chromobacterium aquaticum]MCD5362361.1 hypothetical protein [Chromobacterium aquaticum]
MNAQRGACDDFRRLTQNEPGLPIVENLLPAIKLQEDILSRSRLSRVAVNLLGQRRESCLKTGQYFQQLLRPTKPAFTVSQSRLKRFTPLIRVMLARLPAIPLSTHVTARLEPVYDLASQGETRHCGGESGMHTWYMSTELGFNAVSLKRSKL